MTSSWYVSSEKGPKTFLKAKIALFEVLSQPRFNTVVSCAIVACAKHELKAAIFKTGRRLVWWQDQFKDFKEDQSLKTVSYCSGQINL